MVSIIMPVYNTPVKYLNSSVNSILYQSYKNFEFLIVDESDNNDVLTYFKKVEKEDRRIRYFHFEKGYGYINCLNYGIKKSSGEYIARIDADDIALQTRIQEQVKFFKDNSNIGILGSSVTIIDENGIELFTRNYPNTDKKIKKQLHIWNPICHSSVMIQASIVKKLGGYSNSVDIEDYDLWFRAKKYGVSFANLTKPLMKYRIFDKKNDFNRGRHWKNNIKLKAKHFSFKLIFTSLFGIIIVIAMFIIPYKLQEKLYYHFNRWR